MTILQIGQAKGLWYFLLSQLIQQLAIWNSHDVIHVVTLRLQTQPQWWWMIVLWMMRFLMPVNWFLQWFQSHIVSAYSWIVLLMLIMQETILHDNHIQVYCYSFFVHCLCGFQNNKIWPCHLLLVWSSLLQRQQWKWCKQFIYQMPGIIIDGSTNKFCQNEAVVRNSIKPKSTLKKNHFVICYHGLQEVCALCIIKIAKEDGATI